MGNNLRIKRLERLWDDGRPVCTHAFTLIVDGEMVQDDAPCACGGERITLIAAHDGEGVAGVAVESKGGQANATRKSSAGKSS